MPPPSLLSPEFLLLVFRKNPNLLRTLQSQSGAIRAGTCPRVKKSNMRTAHAAFAPDAVPLHWVEHGVTAAPASTFSACQCWASPANPPVVRGLSPLAPRAMAFLSRQYKLKPFWLNFEELQGNARMNGVLEETHAPDLLNHVSGWPQLQLLGLCSGILGNT
ncbi:hypothetical protein CIHG_02583 [Coccidioides immitis H538.4]|uniref:Uncharacterized protein n=3 Tax=Coccidioides immitis TaxID=5501 RepID=A0A0J8QJ51_COCIT|nr:hypothetical protein CIRG_02911 [Coccidioides immitis RMSCC 2394]KMU72495.1 hypothetical protein CISG_09448 [Coccidioides immitis RMSCC 3703]KMU84799.1 hypothetical protein CIHG_02583 [Coccidioides immitis H538.4]